ncbi:MAG TPA: SRPBCC family protein [Thermoleophilaceae bacterium]
MPTVRRACTIGAGAQELWDVVADPSTLPRWWPDVVRVEEATPLAWTTVSSTPKGSLIRADFTRLAAEEPRRVAWRQEIEESPFERILSESSTEVSLDPGSDGSTRVELRTQQRLRGYARFGGFLFRRAMRRKLDDALAGLERLVVEE